MLGRWIPRKPIVLGGAGFLGRVLVKRLLLAGAEVSVCDRVPWLQGNTQVSFPGSLLNVEIDLVAAKLPRELLEQSDAIFALAATPDMRGKMDSYTSNMKIMSNLMEALLEMPRPLVFLSSAAVYGDSPGDTAARETSTLMSPMSLYGAAKVAGEGLVNAYSASTGVESVIMRPGTLIGDELNHGVLYSIATQASQNGAALRLLGDGGQTRSFVWVEDVADAAVGALGAVPSEAKGRPLVLNVAARGSTSVKDAARIAERLFGLDPSRFTGGDRGWRGDVRHIELSNQRLLSLGWEPAIATSDEVVEYYLTRVAREEVELPQPLYEPNQAAIDARAAGRSQKT